MNKNQNGKPYLLTCVFNWYFTGLAKELGIEL